MPPLGGEHDVTQGCSGAAAELEPICGADGDALSELWALQVPCSERNVIVTAIASTSGSHFCHLRPSAPHCQLQHWGISGATSAPTGELPQGLLLEDLCPVSCVVRLREIWGCDWSL